ncbi:NFACT family protein [Heyndrickxia sporothermodurans]|uniref:Rqc2 homolog RqcH n=1 Tax=Heyndrickxia sporothermodurans TaxID=46224 RepID=A0AB37HC22_9BACI|nr:NFACT RNA binding domain-containing protein [Heyndrickxia sporothermodurans]MBL5766637.1 fibronectin/fibrinogen-binding protein [Heyndrickxia sporothermodurans]MBL5770078.1 fibronectin/fibrinogen-binding protein [Heyndrickxia sporothermodurans]MBL5773756.1 fibronectin/fibrinogen-binding protein [Heyndrickxia sporothermodurans]MBL5777355.1 fibronectin/fibrinogen-binding protein [Heyndrickxia sporothermodurans]MBL5780787.1 fibronectin/fibrinogen-binding protein [Heyndrickxia sporothermodurans
MSFDGLLTRAMTKELAEILVGGRINKIHQPYQNEIIIVIRANGKNHKLLISAHPSYARIQLTNEQHENPQDPSMFCMLLRKHLEGYFIENIYQAGLDRVMIFEIKGRNEIGDISYKQLFVEIMGRHSNVILVDKEKNMIIDSIKHVPSFINSYRTILPGEEYVFPPKQDKTNPLHLTEDEIVRKLDFNSGKMDKQLVENFSGLSPLLAKEIVHRAGLVNRTTIPKAMMDVMKDISTYNNCPTIIQTANKEAFYFIPITYLNGETKSYRTISEMLDRFYFGKAERDRVKQQGHDLERFIKNEREKNETKIEKLKATLLEAENAERYQLFGELLTANLHLVKRGMSEIEVINYYDENARMVKILLDPRKTPSGNAQSYFSKYQKAKTALVIVQEQIEKAREEMKYFDSLLQQMESASPKDIEEIRMELAEEGYIRLKQKRGNKAKVQKITLETYTASDGTEILVGKNNIQNDYLTNKVAGKDDVWLHTKDIPGSHVVIRSKNPSTETIVEAANLAAYYSKAKDSSSVPVDYTKVRYVKKPNGAKPGFVIYEQQQTIYVTPDADKVLEMKK